MQPLSYEKVESFVRMYLGASGGAFIEEANRKGLGRLVSNTLLLTLLLLFYKREGNLPDSRARVLQTVVTYVQDWSDSKTERFAASIPGDVRTQLVAQLAYASFLGGKSYVLDKQSVNAILADSLRDFEAQRRIPFGLTIDQILNNLGATGFVVQTDEGIIFWHRIFVEYFSAIEIARQIQGSLNRLDDFVSDSKFEDVLPLVASRVTARVDFLGKLLSNNIFAAANSLLEFELIEDDIYYQIVDSLVVRCVSRNPAIRRIAMNALRQIEGAYARTQFLNLLTSEFVDVQKVALVEIARRHMPNAHEIVFSRLGWDVRAPTWQEGSARDAVIEALGEFDDPEAHLQIIQFWRTRPDMFTDWVCRQSLLRVIRRKGGVDNEVKQELLSLFLSDDKDMWHKYWGMAEVLIALNDTIEFRIKNATLA